MKLRSGAQVAQAISGGIAKNPKTFQANAEHNAASPLLRLPQEIKNRIYYFVCGGQFVHILQNDRNHNHAHNDKTAELSHAICSELVPEEQVQKDFDSADPDLVAWNIAAVENRHENCQKKGCSGSNQLSLTLLRSCRQIYWEANTVHYANNTFAINCNDILERFVRARFQNKQNLAIRSLHLDISVTHEASVRMWSDSINKAVLKRLKSVRCLYLNFVQLYCICSLEFCDYASEMTESQGKMFKRFSELPLKEATLIIDDRFFMLRVDPLMSSVQIEQDYRWTMKQKQEFSKEVRDALLGRGGVKKDKDQVGKAGL